MTKDGALTQGNKMSFFQETDIFFIFMDDMMKGYAAGNLKFLSFAMECKIILAYEVFFGESATLS
jgi:hypothetical protein